MFNDLHDSKCKGSWVFIDLHDIKVKGNEYLVIFMTMRVTWCVQPDGGYEPNKNCDQSLIKG